MQSGSAKPHSEISLARADSPTDLPTWLNTERLASFLHENLKPYEDPPEEIQAGVDFALSSDPCKGGFVLTARSGEELLGALVMLKTGMSGYIPENILLFVAVAASARGKGIGGTLVRKAVSECEGGVKLHVEHSNPARRLYERCGFTSKYLEMRWSDE
ncbi:MAG: GNAT family N-acetyltransferase [Candidatus Eisenbacteria bacterium]|nr:GNAT family N-acetyltransferase [Candidatus Eisenbacteria bacterium]